MFCIKLKFQLIYPRSRLWLNDASVLTHTTGQAEFFCPRWIRLVSTNVALLLTSSLLSFISHSSYILLLSFGCIKVVISIWVSIELSVLSLPSSDRCAGQWCNWAKSAVVDLNLDSTAVELRKPNRQISGKGKQTCPCHSRGALSSRHLRSKRE